MATPQKGKPKPSRIVGSVSRFAGTLVGTAVVAGKRIISSAVSPSKGQSGRHEGKTMRAPATQKKKAVRKTEIKVPKTKKKKVAKRKTTGSSGKSVAPKKGPTQSPAKRRKIATAGKKTTRRKTKKTAKSEKSSHPQVGLISGTAATMNVPIGK